jgi:cytochrome c oxidase subunit IV
MTATTTDHDAHSEEHPHEEHGLSDWGYIKVALLLAVLTGLEVATYFVDIGALEVPALLILMVVKFAIVVAYFMHLKFDDSLFTKLFVTGLVLALLVYGAFLTTLVFWGDPSGSRVQDLGALGFI